MKIDDDKAHGVAGCILVIIGLAVVSWLLDEMATSPLLPTISTLVFFGVIIYLLFFKSR